MADVLTTAFVWFKALHVIAVMAWMAGIFYLPRLFVRHAENADNPANGALLKDMERKLYHIIMNPAMMAAWSFALLMIVTGYVDVISGWFAVKLLAVLVMTGFHFWCKKRLDEFARDANSHSGRYYRIANEVPTLLMIIIVIMVIVKPF